MRFVELLNTGSNRAAFINWVRNNITNCMQQIYIPSERVKALRKDSKLLQSLEKVCNCKCRIEDDSITVASESDNGYDEFVARNIITAFGRGFDLRIAELLHNDDYYFATIDIGQRIGSDKRVLQVKSRVIGESGKTKIYIESVSGAKISVYGDTVSFIGTATQISEAETAVNTLIEGGTHKMAYSKMEAAHRKNKAQRHDPTF